MRKINKCSSCAVAGELAGWKLAEELAAGELDVCELAFGEPAAATHGWVRSRETKFLG